MMLLTAPALRTRVLEMCPVMQLQVVLPLVGLRAQHAGVGPGRVLRDAREEGLVLYVVEL